MSIATKKELETLISAIYLDIASTRDSVETEPESEYRKGYLDACNGVLSLIGIGVKTFRIYIETKQQENENG